MMKFNQVMQEAGIVLALDGLHPPRWARASPSKAASRA